MIRALTLALILFGCTHAQRQRTLTTTARLSLVDTVDARIVYYDARNAHCRGEYPPNEYTFADWRGCMDPAYVLKTAVETADHSFRALQHALDASDEDSVRDALPAAIEALGRLLSAFTAAGLDIPEEVTKASALIRSLAKVYL